MQELEALGAAIAKGLGAPGAMPAEVGWFPSAGQLPDSVRFVPADALGQATFANAFEAKYEKRRRARDGDRHRAVRQRRRRAAAALARYESFLSKRDGQDARSWRSPGDGGFSAQDAF